jgi:hypothetical protein
MTNMGPQAYVSVGQMNGVLSQLSGGGGGNNHHNFSIKQLQDLDKKSDNGPSIFTAVKRDKSSKPPLGAKLNITEKNSIPPIII